IYLELLSATTLQNSLSLTLLLKLTCPQQITHLLALHLIFLFDRNRSLLKAPILNEEHNL
uniref:Uncharacterized protein n=1 Tax=Calidris pygmaea TaxID=425635 RepID=A0A8C3JSE3_9CHAR